MKLPLLPLTPDISESVEAYSEPIAPWTDHVLSPLARHLCGKSHGRGRSNGWRQQRSARRTNAGDLYHHHAVQSVKSEGGATGSLTPQLEEGGEKKLIKLGEIAAKRVDPPQARMQVARCSLIRGFWSRTGQQPAVVAILRADTPYPCSHLAFALTRPAVDHREGAKIVLAGIPLLVGWPPRAWGDLDLRAHPKTFRFSLFFFFGPTEPFDSNDRRHVYRQVLQRHALAHADATARQAAAGWPSCPFSSPPPSGPKIKYSHPPALCQHVAYVSASATSLCPFPTCPPVPRPSCRRQLSFSPSHGRARRQ